MRTRSSGGSQHVLPRVFRVDSLAGRSGDDGGFCSAASKRRGDADQPLRKRKRSTDPNGGNTADQQGLGLHACGLVTVHLFAQLGLNGLEQVPIDNSRLLALEDLALKRHVSDIEAIAEQVSERSARERDAASVRMRQRPVCAG